MIHKSMCRSLLDINLFQYHSTELIGWFKKNEIKSDVKLKSGGRQTKER